MSDGFTNNDLLYYIIGNNIITDIKLIDYIDEFEYILLKILKNGRHNPSTKEYIEYLNSDAKDKKHKLAVNVFKQLKKRAGGDSWTKRDTEELEIALYRLISATIIYDYIKYKNKRREGGKKRHEEDHILRKYIEDLNKEHIYKSKDFFKTYKNDIKYFIKKNCPSIHKKIEEEKCDLYEKIENILHRKI